MPYTKQNFHKLALWNLAVISSSNNYLEGIWGSTNCLGYYKIHVYVYLIVKNVGKMLPFHTAMRLFRSKTFSGSWVFFCLFVWVLGGVFWGGGCPSWEFDTSPLPVKGLKFWSILGTRGHWILSIFRNARICYRSFGSGRAVTSCFNDLGLSRPGIEPHAACETNTLPTATAAVTWSQNVDIRIDALIVYICN